MRNADTWSVEFDARGITGPDGEYRSATWEHWPAPSDVHDVMDRWAADGDLVARLPHIGPWSSWWPIRFHLHRVLLNLAPQLSLLQHMRKEMVSLPKKILLQHPPEPWWFALFRILFSDTDVRVDSPGAVAGKVDMPTMALTLKRMWATHQRMRSLVNLGDDRPRVLLFSRDRVWTGERDTELQTVIDALEQAGMAVIVVVHWFASPAEVKRSLYTRPPDHIFAYPMGLRGSFDWSRRPTRFELALPSRALSFQGIDLTVPACQFIQAAWSGFYSETPRIAGYFHDLASALNIRAAVMTDEYIMNRPARLGLMWAGIPTIAVQHGVIHRDHLGYIYPADVAPESVPLSQVTCLYGECDRRLLTECSVYREADIAVTGQVRMDLRDWTLHPMGTRSRNSHGLRNRVLPQGCDRLLFFTSQGLYRSTTGPRLLRALALSQARHFLIIRPHPLEWSDDFWIDMIDKFGLSERVLVDREVALDDWLDACDLHVSGNSTVLSEAVVWGRPNLIIGARALGDFNLCLDAGVARDLDSFSSLDEAVASVLAESRTGDFELRRRDYVEDHFFRLDGDAGKRIAEVVGKVVRDKVQE